MNLLIHEMEKRKRYLEKLLLFIKQQLIEMPPGSLRISNNRGIPRYYHITKPKDKLGKYISKENEKIVYQLAQKDYLNKLIKKAEAELQDINCFLNNHKSSDLEDIYTFLNTYRKDLITPFVQPDDLYVQRWESESYETNQSYLDEKIYPTKKGEFVRSKSEVLLADMYYELGIPYRYDAEVRLRDGTRKYPDFTLLDVKNRRLIYHEHFGLLDDAGYRKKNLRKLDEYRRSGIYFGKNLILTYEAEGIYLNVNEIREMIKEMDLLG